MQEKYMENEMYFPDYSVIPFTVRYGNDFLHIYFWILIYGLFPSTPCIWFDFLNFFWNTENIMDFIKNPDL